MMAYYDNKVSNALLDCFPTIGLDVSKFPWFTRMLFEQRGAGEEAKGRGEMGEGGRGERTQVNKVITHSVASWNEAENRRALFDKYAKENNFDPLIPENWYHQPIKRIMATKVRSTFIYSLLQTFVNHRIPSLTFVDLSVTIVDYSRLSLTIFISFFLLLSPSFDII